MRRAVSIHIGVNQPGGRACTQPVLMTSEEAAWRMAALASQAGYESLQVLRGRAATRFAVHNALTGAAGMLETGDNLLVTFSGHGGQLNDARDAEPNDESWCLFDGQLVDDKLAGYWRLFEPGVRIVVISDSCFSGGMNRNGDEDEVSFQADDGGRRPRGGEEEVPGARGWRGDAEDDGRRSRNGGDSWDGSARLHDGGDSSSPAPAQGTGNGAAPAVSCITEAARDANAIHATVLMLTASSETRPAIDGLFTRALLQTWNDGAFRKSYCELHAEVSALVAQDSPRQEPQIFILGAATPDFALEPAFHLRDADFKGLYATDEPEVGYRGDCEQEAG
ncbi:MAG TPA: caspase family protein [Longimicrobium sp.]|nr:caspase family protein [Longimicrobium sp.]